jgi:ABC-type sugar transport system permease subunit
MLSERKSAAGWLYILPLLIGIAIFSVYPALNVLWMSAHEIELANLQEARFVGIRNYLLLFQSTNPPLGRILWLTFTFVFVSVAFHVTLGFTLANLLFIPWVRGKNVWRTTYMISWVAASVVVGFTFRFLFEPRAGILNYLLRLVDLPAQSWTADPRLAFPVIIAVNIWRGVPYSLIIQTGGLQSINPELFDAAVVDGAGPLQVLARIKIPLVKEFLLLDIVLDTVETFQVFETILALTGGGPLHKTETMAVYMYLRAFRFGEIGKGAGIGVVLLAISLVFAVIYIRFLRPREDEL